MSGRWTPGPYEGPITDDQVEELAPRLVELAKTEGWLLYEQLLTTLIHRGREAGFEDRDKIDNWIGYVEGLKHALAVVPDLVAKAKAQIRADVVRKKARTFSPSDAGDLSL